MKRARYRRILQHMIWSSLLSKTHSTITMKFDHYFWSYGLTPWETLSGVFKSFHICVVCDNAAILQQILIVIKKIYVDNLSRLLGFLPLYVLSPCLNFKQYISNIFSHKIITHTIIKHLQNNTICTLQQLHQIYWLHFIFPSEHTLLIFLSSGN